MKFQDRLLARFGLWIGLCFVLIVGVNSYLGATRIRRGLESHLHGITDSLSATVRTSYAIYQAQVAANIRTAAYFLRGGVRLSPDARLEWTAVQQITGEVQRVALPVLEAADDQGNWSAIDPGFADRITELLGGTVTVFQRFDSGFLRLSTSVPGHEGQSAEGTYIPLDSPVSTRLLAGEDFVGRAFVVHDWYLTSYRPLFDADGVVIGAIYVGISQQGLNILREEIRAFHAGDTYYSTVFDIQGNLIIHPRWQGMNLSDVPDEEARSAGRQMIARILDQGLSEGRIEYSVDGRARVNFYSFVPEMDWVVVSGLEQAEIRRETIAYISVQALLTLLLLLGLLVVIRTLSRRVARPLEVLTAVAVRISQRDFSVEVPELPDWETKRLGESLVRMAGDLGSFYNQLERKVEQRTRELEKLNEAMCVAHDQAIEARANLEFEVEQRQATERKLRESESQYRTLVSSLPGVIFRISAEPPFLLQFISDAVTGLTGQRPQELTGGEFAALLLGGDRDRFRATVMDAATSGRPFQADFRFCRADGMEGWFNIRGAPVESSGEFRIVDCAAFDITMQKQAGEKLQEVREQAAEQRGKLEMSASVLHDIGNAITNLSTSVNRLVAGSAWEENRLLEQFVGFLCDSRTQIEAALGEEKVDALCHFVHELSAGFGKKEAQYRDTFLRLASVTQHVSEILHLQRRYSAGSSVGSREALNLHLVLADALSIFAGSFDKRRIVLKQSLAEGNLIINGDRTRILQVFNNILKNACEAIDERVAGDPTAPREVEVFSSSGKGKGFLEIGVRDTGIGFDAADQERFSRRGHSTKPGGSGIGLDQCRQILQAHRGEFAISSAGRGTGATVTLRFPGLQP